MPQIGKLTYKLVMEMDWDTKSEFAEACARDGKEKALADGNNELARHYSLRISEILHQRAWVAELAKEENTAETAVPHSLEIQ